MDDTILEDNENFVVIAQSNDQRVQIPNCCITITIVDDDRKIEIA